MTILVDEAQWPWRDTYWCHLVTDSHLDELHEFAGRVGSRRVGFQGDHYDIDIRSREVAIELGAEKCDSRDLVRRLKDAGLRMRPLQFTKWSLVTRGDGEAPPAEFVPPILQPYVQNADGFFVLERERADGTMAKATVLSGENKVDLPQEDASAGFFVRTDIDDVWSIEAIYPAPTPQE